MDRNILVFGVNDRDQESARAWVERESLPFPVLLDKERSIAIAYGMSKAGDERYLANPADGRSPAVILDEEGLVLTAQLASALGRPRQLAQKAAYCLRESGVIHQVGKSGNALRYSRSAA